MFGSPPNDAVELEFNDSCVEVAMLVAPKLAPLPVRHTPSGTAMPAPGALHGQRLHSSNPAERKESLRRRERERPSPPAAPPRAAPASAPLAALVVEAPQRERGREGCCCC
jgi:hypothetical protein